jgi:protein SCO1/2
VSPRLSLAAAIVLSVLALAGCDRLFAPSRSPFQGIDVTGGDMGGELRLNDHEGKPRSIADFRGKLVVVSFGYTNCPDVCPTTLADLSSTLKLLGNDASQVQVLFVTVDPKRDTQELLRHYVPAFHPSFIGLWGDEAATARATKDFHVYASVREGRTPGSYTVDHSGQIFVLDREGKMRLIFAPATPPAAMAEDLRILLRN